MEDYDNRIMTPGPACQNQEPVKTKQLISSEFLHSINVDNYDDDADDGPLLDDEEISDEHGELTELPSNAQAPFSAPAALGNQCLDDAWTSRTMKATLLEEHEDPSVPGRLSGVQLGRKSRNNMRYAATLFAQFVARAAQEESHNAETKVLTADHLQAALCALGLGRLLPKTYIEDLA